MPTKKELEIEIQRLEERLESAYEQRNQIIENGSEWTKKYVSRIEELEGFIRTIVDENPSIFCCFNCIPNAPNPPRHVVDVFRLGLENECECKGDE
tara:strand:- start:5119 stop:5406 length:288 start_codon:yes stop_codon:yes gene_type:complete